MVLGVGRSEGSILYSQPAQYPPDGFNGYTSTVTPSGPTFQTYDNFTLAQSGVITSISWQGLYWDFTGPAGNPAAPNTTSFELDFYSNNAGQPGTLLSSQTLNNVGSQFVAQAFFGPDNTGQNDLVNVLNFNGDLANPFSAAAGQEFWVSIVSHSNSELPYWLWTSGTGGDGQSFQFDSFSGTGRTANGDRAFTLVGAPEPQSWALLAGGIPVLTGFLWARRKRLT
jgi:hypothetical protein